MSIEQRDKSYQKVTLITAICCAVALSLVQVNSQVAFAGELELSDAQNAKLARHRAKERVMKNERQESYIDDETPDPSTLNEDEDCGSVDIGNVVNNKGFGGPKKIDVIITGDVINANNDC